MRLEWRGKGIRETARVMQPGSTRTQKGQVVVKVDPRYFRPAEVETLLGDPSKARAKLGWAPKTSFTELVAEMMREDLKLAKRDELVKKKGYKTYEAQE